MKTSSYLKYVYEIIAIVIGITLSFLVDEWREDNQNREQLESNLKALKFDLQKDIENADNIIEYYDSASSIYLNMFNDIDGNENLSFEEMRVLYDNLTDIGVKLQDNTFTYEALIKLNLFKYLKNDSILIEMNEYYGYWKDLLSEYEGGVKERMEINKRLLNKYVRNDIGILALVTQKPVNMEEIVMELNKDYQFLLKNQEFRSNNSTQLLFHKYFARLFERYRAQSQHLIELIDKELES